MKVAQLYLKTLIFCKTNTKPIKTYQYTKEKSLKIYVIVFIIKVLVDHTIRSSDHKSR